MTQVFIAESLERELAYLGFRFYCSFHLKCLFYVVAFCALGNPSVLFPQGQMEKAFDCH